MKKLIFGILNWCVIVTMVFALIGVNITKLYCAHCEDAHVEVDIASSDVDACCGEGCGCCEHENEEGGCICIEDQFHAFYRITEALQTEQRFHADVVCFCYVAESNFSFDRLASFYRLKNAYLPDEYPDISPPQEFLCTYRC